MSKRSPRELLRLQISERSWEDCDYIKRQRILLKNCQIKFENAVYCKKDQQLIKNDFEEEKLFTFCTDNKNLSFLHACGYKPRYMNRAFITDDIDLIGQRFHLNGLEIKFEW